MIGLEKVCLSWLYEIAFVALVTPTAITPGSPRSLSKACSMKTSRRLMSAFALESLDSVPFRTEASLGRPRRPAPDWRRNANSLS
jgi:hypothetical protein